MRRPMERVAAPLRLMGASDPDTGRPAAAVDRGGHALRGYEHALEIPSAQVKSALLLAGLYAAGPTRVSEPGVSRDHTERMLEAFGVNVVSSDSSAGIAGPATLTATRIVIPGDFSSAAFFVVADWSRAARRFAFATSASIRRARH